MEAYKIQETIGEGSFAVVLKATHIKTGEIVAMKKIKKKFNSWDECMSLRELKSLRKLNHENIIKLKEALKVKDELYFVFEHMEQNVYQLYNQLRDNGRSFNENQIRDIVYQTASGLAYMHKHGFFHRDLKPENLLINKGVTKIADFGLAREIRSRPPYTDYVATRWYRAPEILLKSTNYNSPVDVFALGCIMAELYLMAPLFKGNTEMEQMFKICSVLGTPTQATWNEGLRLAAQVGFSFPELPAVNLATVIPNASEEAIQLITEMLRFDPQKRPSAQQVLQHPYFANFIPNQNPLLMAVPSFDKPLTSRGTHDQLSARGKENNLTARGLEKNDPLDNFDDHLDLLDDLEFETKLEKNESDYSTKKTEKKPSVKEIKVDEDEDHPDDLLAEIEGYINSDTSKDLYGKNPSLSKGYSQPSIKPTLNNVQSGNIKAPLGYSDSKGRLYDMSQDAALYDSLSKKNTDSLDSYYNKMDKYSMDNKYTKYGNGSQMNSQSTRGLTNVSNREAQIMSTFVYTSNNAKPSPGSNMGNVSGRGQFDW